MSSFFSGAIDSPHVLPLPSCLPRRSTTLPRLRSLPTRTRMLHNKRGYLHTAQQNEVKTAYPTSETKTKTKQNQTKNPDSLPLIYYRIGQYFTKMNVCTRHYKISNQPPPPPSPAPYAITFLGFSPHLPSPLIGDDADGK